MGFDFRLKKSQMVSTRSKTKMSTETVFYELVPVKATVVARVKKQKQKQDQDLSYKSIIRTRAQKQREQLQYMETMFSNINNYVEMYKTEPTVGDSVSEVAAMGRFLSNLRTVFKANVMDGQIGIEKVMHYMPWFRFDVPVVEKPKASFSLGFLMFVCFTVPALFMATQYLTYFCYSQNSCMALADETYNSAAHFTRITGHQMYNGYQNLQRVTTEFLNTF